MATRPRNRRVDRGIIERGGVTPIRFLTGLMLDRMEKRDERKYMDSLKKMGMLDKGGGRANVPPKKKSKPKNPPRDYRPPKKSKSDTQKLMEESKKKYGKRMRNISGDGVRMRNISPEAEKRLEKKKKPPKKTRVYKTVKGGRIDGIAIRGKTKGTIR